MTSRRSGNLETTKVASSAIKGKRSCTVSNPGRSEYGPNAQSGAGNRLEQVGPSCNQKIADLTLPESLLWRKSAKAILPTIPSA